MINKDMVLTVFISLWFIVNLIGIYGIGVNSIFYVNIFSIFIFYILILVKKNNSVFNNWLNKDFN
jgi:hypothetical protein